MTDLFSLVNKHILITGASSGIGRGISQHADRAEAQLTLAGRNWERLQLTVDTLQQETRSFIGDLSDPGDIDQLAREVSPLDGLVLNAGIMGMAPLTKITDEQLTTMIDINLRGTIQLMRALYSHKKIRKGASVVFITSIAGGLIGSPANSLYGATKGGIAAFARALAVELARKKIRVNCIAPGMIETEGGESMLANVSAAAIEEDKRTYPLGRYGTPEDVACAARYLLSDAAAWVTGTTLVLDGGLTAK